MIEESEGPRHRRIPPALFAAVWAAIVAAWVVWAWYGGGFGGDG